MEQSRWVIHNNRILELIQEESSDVKIAQIILGTSESTIANADVNGFPAAPVYSIGFGQSKVQVAKDSGIDVFVDDSFKNFVELRNAGISCFLFDAPHNRRYNVGYYRISSLKELTEKIKI